MAACEQGAGEANVRKAGQTLPSLCLPEVLGDSPDPNPALVQQMGSKEGSRKVISGQISQSGKSKLAVIGSHVHLFW